MILVTIFGGIVLHAPMSVGLGVLFPQVSLVIKAWKEILLIIAGILAIILMHQNRRFDILRRPIMIAVGLFGLWHLILLFWQPTGLLSAIAGLIIDLRYILFFGLMYIAMNLYPDYKRLFVKVGLIGALVVLIFG
ncbi:hypothetical protein HGB24_03860, partial [Candidatus Saccharibacteria bacterium]|nr:hypothetical protein [Candidatus Saccharibacteria bacterium]